MYRMTLLAAEIELPRPNQLSIEEDLEYVSRIEPQIIHHLTGRIKRVVEGEGLAIIDLQLEPFTVLIEQFREILAQTDHAIGIRWLRQHVKRRTRMWILRTHQHCESDDHD
ncbi:MAG: hypothetical protein R3F12_05870 [Lysobacteraceae bacterium]|nr:hypothetical protein [Xanthomonadales bacterium]HRX98513.1 hypothetical protein [Xanthomonadaceae bacterium]